MDENGMRPADFAAMANNMGGGNSWWCFLLIILFFICGFNGSGWGGGNQANGVLDSTLAAAAAQGGYVTSNQMNDALRLQSIQQGQRDITDNVNQNKYDITNAMNATEQRLTANQSNLLANQAANAQAQQACCADVKYNSAINTASINETTTAQTQRVLDALAADKAERLARENAEKDRRISQLETQMQMQAQQAQTQQQFGTINGRLNMMPTYPNTYAYNAGPSPFCGCGQCCGQVA